jgi:hypothetical protein
MPAGWIYCRIRVQFLCNVGDDLSSSRPIGVYAELDRAEIEAPLSKVVREQEYSR